MSRLKLGEWAQIAEIVAAVAVVFSLVYVGLELRENTSAVRAASVQAITTGTRDALMTVASDAELARVVRLGAYDRSSLTDDEKYRFSIFSRQRWLFFQGIWIQHQLDVLDENSWQSYRQLVCNLLDNSGNREEWPYHIDVLNAEFVAWVQECSAETDRTD